VIELKAYYFSILNQERWSMTCAMETTLRKHITLLKSTYQFLEDYQRRQHLPNFSAAIEAAAQALKQQSLLLAMRSL
jgi:hypothetical protein